MALVTAAFGIVAVSAASALSFCPVVLALLAAQWCGQIGVSSNGDSNGTPRVYHSSSWGVRFASFGIRYVT